MHGLLVYMIYSVRTSSHFHFLCTVKDINTMLDSKHGLKCGLKHGLKGVPRLGKEMRCRKMKKGCGDKCKYKCHENVSGEMRENI